MLNRTYKDFSINNSIKGKLKKREIIETLTKPTIPEFQLKILISVYIAINEKLIKFGINESEINNKKLRLEDYNIPKILDNYLYSIGLGKYERLILFKTLNEFYTNPKKEFENYYNSLIREFETEIYDLENLDLITPSGKQETMEKLGIKSIKLNQFLQTENLNKKTGIGLEFEDILELRELIDYLKFQLSTIESRTTRCLLNLKFKPSGLTNDEILISVSSFLDKNHKLKRTEDGNNYLFDNDLKRYKQFDSKDLGALIKIKYGISNLKQSDLETLTNLSKEYSKLENKIVRLEDGFLNTDTWEFTQTKELYKIFTNKYYPYYFEPVEIIDPEKAILEKTLKQILIPKLNQKYDLILKDFKERLGSCLNHRNKHKTITIYYGDGNNAKSSIMKIIETLLQERVVQVNLKKIMEDNFTDFPEGDVWLIDEIDKNGFKDYVDILKNITNTFEKGNKQRKMHSEKMYNKRNPSHIFIFTNELPVIPIDNGGKQLIERLDIIELPNKFVSNPNPDKNEYEVNIETNGNIENIPKKHYQKLFVDSVKSYQKRVKNNPNYEYPLKQSYETTYRILNKHDPLKSFIITHYSLDETGKSRTYNKEIKENYTNYCKYNNIQTEIKDLDVRIGRTIMEIFGNIKGTSNTTYYYLKRRNKQDLEYKNNTKYYVEDIDFKKTINNNLKGDSLEVFQTIQDYNINNKPITHEKLLKLYINKFDLDNVIEKLLDNDLIRLEKPISDIN